MNVKWGSTDICQWLLFRQKVIEAALMDVISSEHLVFDCSKSYSLQPVSPFSHKVSILFQECSN